MGRVESAWAIGVRICHLVSTVISSCCFFDRFHSPITVGLSGCWVGALLVGRGNPITLIYTGSLGSGPRWCVWVGSRDVPRLILLPVI